MVIAIISILAGLLLPALQKARAQALLTSCSSNIKQQFIGFSTYAIDYNGLYPGRPRNWNVTQFIGVEDRVAADPTGMRSTWANRVYVHNYLNIKLKNPDAFTVNNFYTNHRAIIAPDILTCPSVNYMALVAAGGGAGLDSNSVNSAILYHVGTTGDAGWDNLADAQLSRFSRMDEVGRRHGGPGRVALVLDRLYNTSAANYISSNMSMITPHKNEVANVMTADGSIRSERLYGGAYYLPVTLNATNDSGLILPVKKYYLHRVGSGYFIRDTDHAVTTDRHPFFTLN